LHDGRYETIMGSDVARDGMVLELWDRPSNKLALWAFFSDADGSFEVTRYRTDVPPEVEAWCQAEARRRVPPVANAAPGAAADGGGTEAFWCSCLTRPPPLLSWVVGRRRGRRRSISTHDRSGTYAVHLGMRTRR
jgi:hypothetical protein